MFKAIYKDLISLLLDSPVDRNYCDLGLELNISDFPKMYYWCVITDLYCLIGYQ